MRRFIVAALVAFAGLGGAQAQTYPSKQITLVVPFPPGGSTDVTARIMAEKMRPILGQPALGRVDGPVGLAQIDGACAVGKFLAL